MRYYIISGEASGDMHSANLCKEIKRIDSQAEIRGWGGRALRAVGVDVIKDYKDTAFMGFVEVVKNIRTIFQLFDFCKTDIDNFQPDVLILVDYPGFNLRMAKWASKRSIKVAYYIAPQVWAWKKGRIKQMKKTVDQLFVILPFEPDFFAQYGMATTYVGHPLTKHIQGFKKADNFRESFGLGGKPIVALLPGSRKQEIAAILPEIKFLITRNPEFQFVIGGLKSIGLEFYKANLGEVVIPIVF